MSNNDLWYMAGTEGTGEYRVLSVRNIGKEGSDLRVGIRDLGNDLFRIRVETEWIAEAHIEQVLTRQAGWKQPGDGGQQRFSKVVNLESSEGRQDLLLALLVAGAYDEFGEINPEAPEWVRDFPETLKTMSVKELRGWLRELGYKPRVTLNRVELIKWLLRDYVE